VEHRVLEVKMQMSFRLFSLPIHYTLNKLIKQVLYKIQIKI